MEWVRMMQNNIGSHVKRYGSMKRITDEVTKIAQLETTFRDRALMWYMKYKATTLAGQARSLIEIK
jgi:hypothetical protein